MAYCVNCGVELDKTASGCPLCFTPVYRPDCPIQKANPINCDLCQKESHPDCPLNSGDIPPFPKRRKEVESLNRKELALVITTLMAAASASCVIINLFFFFPQIPWAMYTTGTLALLWVWLIFPLCWKGMHPFGALFLDTSVSAFYLMLIAWTVDGWKWYLQMVLPILVLFAIIFGIYGCVARKQKSFLIKSMLFIGSFGVFLLGVEPFVDIFFKGFYTPGWSVVTSGVVFSLILTLLVIQCSPTIREEAKKKFHL